MNMTKTKIMMNMTIMKTTKIFIFLSIFLLSSCASYMNVDQAMNKLTPPITLISRSSPNMSGYRTYKLRDGNGKTYTCSDNSLESIVPGSVIVPNSRPSFSDVDDVLMKLKSPVVVVGKSGLNGEVLKIKDRKNKLVTIEDLTLSSYEVGDTIK